MARTYTLNARADKQAATRRRIVEAAVALHGSIGPARTTVSMVAERAGVQRHTFYAHFPEERDLFLACSGYVFERDPLPDAEAWTAIADRSERLRAGLGAIYGWFERNAQLAACVLRDAEYHAQTGEAVALRFGPPMARYREVLGAKLNAKQRAMLQVALNFFSWRTLARDCGLKRGGVVALMVRAVESASEG